MMCTIHGTIYTLAGLWSRLTGKRPVFDDHWCSIKAASAICQSKCEWFIMKNQVTRNIRHNHMKHASVRCNWWNGRQWFAIVKSSRQATFYSQTLEGSVDHKTREDHEAHFLETKTSTSGHLDNKRVQSRMVAPSSHPRLIDQSHMFLSELEDRRTTHGPLFCLY